MNFINMGIKQLSACSRTLLANNLPALADARRCGDVQPCVMLCGVYRKHTSDR